MKGKILVVDDELHIRMLYQEELEDKGYEVITSDGSDNILEILEKERPDVVILDIRLGSNRSGLDILQEIRTREQHDDVSIILCTAYDSFQHDVKSIAADYYVVKSVDLTELLDKVEQAMSGGMKRKDEV